MREVITGNEAAARGAALARAEVIPIYPITPQTTIIEGVSDLVRQGRLKARILHVESEHSAMAACIGAATTGVRTFTATSSQGLLLMHELLHWASLARLPIVIVDVNRAVAPGWSIWTDQNDSLSQRDTGWIQFYCENNQEVLDTVVQAYRVSEETRLPSMVVLDAFVLSHTAEPVEVPTADEIDGWLPRVDPPFKLDVEKPCSFGALVGPDLYQEFRRNLQDAMGRALVAVDDAARSWADRFGRLWPAVESYRTEGADLVLVASATAASTARDVVDAMRERGRKVGLVKIRLFRPFPVAAVREALAGIPRVAVLDRNHSPGHHGIFFQELKSALFGSGVEPEMHGFIAGLGGRDITPESIEEVFARAADGAPSFEPVWIGGPA